MATQRAEQLSITQHRHPELLRVGLSLDVAVDALQLIVEPIHQAVDQRLGFLNGGARRADKLGLNLFEALAELGELRRERRLAHWFCRCWKWFRSRC